MTPEQHKQKLARIEYLMDQQELDEEQDAEFDRLLDEVEKYEDKLYWERMMK